MSLVTGFLFLTLLIGCIAIPVENGEENLSVYFDQEGLSARIVGGSEADSVPYIVALTVGDSRSFFCAGSLITTNHVLTAAHCVSAVYFDEDLLRSLRGYVGTDRYDSGGTEYSFSQNITHPNYDPILIKSDISMLVTTTEVVLSDRVHLATLNFDYIYAGVRTIAYGWGATSLRGPLSETILKVDAIVVGGEECMSRMEELSDEYGISAPAVDPTVEICTYNSNGNGTCNGDSGGPLMHAELDTQIGVVSWGLPCARGAPDVFARVSAFCSWVEENMQRKAI